MALTDQPITLGQPEHSGRVFPAWWQLLLFFAAYILAAGFAELLAIIPGIGISIWPASGVFLATLLVTRNRSWPWWILAALTAEITANQLWFHNPMPIAVVLNLGNACEAVAGAMLIRLACRGSFKLETLRDVMILVTLGAVVAPCVSATVGAATLSITQQQPLLKAWVLWWVGDATGMLIVAPLVLILVHDWPKRAVVPAAVFAEVALLGLAFIGVAVLSLGGLLPFAYLIMPPLLWAAVRFDFRGAVVANVLLAALSAAFTVGGIGQFAGDPDSQHGRNILLQLFLAISAVSGLVVAAIAGQRRLALERLRKSNDELEQRVEDRSSHLRRSEEELRRTADTLNRERERLAIALRTGRLGAYDWTPKDDKVWWSPETYPLFGVDPATFTPSRESFGDLVHPDDRDELWRRTAESLAKREVFTFEYRIIRPDGQTRWVANRSHVLLGQSGDVELVTGVVADITERRAAEEALRASEEFTRHITDIAPCILYVYDLEKARNVWGNREMIGILGYSIEEIKAMSGRLLDELLHPEDKPRYHEHASKLFTLADGEAAEFQYRMLHAGGSYRWLLSRDMIFRRDNHGQPRQIIGAALDVTDRKAVEDELDLHRRHLQQLVEDRTTELESSHQRLRIAERMASLGTLAAGLGHDMGNLLMPMRVRLDTLERSGLPPEVQAELEGIRSSASYLQKLASGLRLLSIEAAGAPPTESTEIGSWWSEAGSLLRATLPRGVQLVSDPFPTGELWARVSRAALMQAVFNLVQNAGDALKDQSGGRVHIAIRGEPQHVVFAITDNGPGMSDEVQRRCMEPFYTTKTRGLSTGLGLSLVYGLVRDAAGTIELESALGRGTTFTLRFSRGVAPELESAEPVGSASVDVADARIRAYIVSELKRSRFEIKDSADAVVDIAILDDHKPDPRASVVVRVEPRTRLHELRSILMNAVAGKPADRYRS